MRFSPYIVAMTRHRVGGIPYDTSSDKFDSRRLLGQRKPKKQILNLPRSILKNFMSEKVTMRGKIEKQGGFFVVRFVFLG